MSAPDTNVRKQTRKHRPPLIGMIVAVAIAVLAFIAWLALAPTEDAAPGDEPLAGTGQSAAPDATAEGSVDDAATTGGAGAAATE